MKNKLSFISIFTLCIALSLTACGVKQASTTDSKKGFYRSGLYRRCNNKSCFG